MTAPRVIMIVRWALDDVPLRPLVTGPLRQAVPEQPASALVGVAVPVLLSPTHAGLLPGLGRDGVDRSLDALLELAHGDHSTSGESPGRYSG
jgi:hypothetical protein